MTRELERAKILQDFLRANNNPKMELNLIMAAFKDAASESSQEAVKKMREEFLGILDRRISGTTELTREVLIEISKEVRLLWR